MKKERIRGFNRRNDERDRQRSFPMRLRNQRQWDKGKKEAGGLAGSAGLRARGLKLGWPNWAGSAGSFLFF